MTEKLNANDRLTVRIEKLVPRGLGLAFAGGKTVFVPLSAEGDLLDVRVGSVRGRVAFAEIETVLEPSPDRIAPPCEYYGVCGGCDLQHLNYEAQLRAKVGFIRDCLERLGKVKYDAEIPIVPSPDQFGYRSRVRWQADTDRRSLGFLRRGSHEVVDIHDCPILVPALRTLSAALRENIGPSETAGGSYEIEAASNGVDVSIHSMMSSDPPERLEVEAAGERYELSANSFFQANLSMIGPLIDAVVGVQGGKTALDLYCGVGLFTLPLARKFEHVTGVESDSTAVRCARTNVYNAGLQNVNIDLSGAANYLSSTDIREPDLVVLDPPRSGPEKETIRLLSGLKPKQIVYVSCEPSILARDLRQLMDAGYLIDSIAALDLFPQTHHVETVVRLTIGGG